MPRKTLPSCRRQDSALAVATRRGNRLIVEVVHDTFVEPDACLELARGVRELIEREDCHRLVLETSRVEFLSSIFLGVLVQLLGGCRRRGGRLIVVTTRLTHQELFRLHHLDDFFGLTDNVEEALASLGADG